MNSARSSISFEIGPTKLFVTTSANNTNNNNSKTKVKSKSNKLPALIKKVVEKVIFYFFAIIK
jgi:hypothetical protein